MSGMRYLVRTRETVDPTEWPAEFAHLEAESAQLLADSGVTLFGLDTEQVQVHSPDCLLLLFARQIEKEQSVEALRTTEFWW